MPRIAYFFGISIYMYLDDHGTPHCHGIYGDYAGSFAIQTGEYLVKFHHNKPKKLKISFSLIKLN